MSIALVHFTQAALFYTAEITLPVALFFIIKYVMKYLDNSMKKGE